MRFLKRLWAFLFARAVQQPTVNWELLPLSFRVDWYLRVDADLEKVGPYVPPDKGDH